LISKCCNWKFCKA